MRVTSLPMASDSGPRRKAAQLRAEAHAHAAEVERLRSEAELWDRGADGEDVVQALLEAGLAAEQGWRVERSVITSSRGADIDHVVVGPAGVFTINTKHHPGKKIWASPGAFLVDGHRTDYLRKSREEAKRAQERLGAACGYSVSVQSVIVVVGAASLNVVEQPDQPRIEAADHVVAWLQDLPPVLSAEQASVIAGVVGNSDTWIKKRASSRQIPAPRATYRRTSAARPGGRRSAARRTSLATPVLAVIAIVIAFAILRHHPNSSDGLSGSTTTTSAAATSTTLSAAFQAVGTVTNEQCVDAWSNHGVEVEIFGAHAGADCTSIASPGELATETSSAAAYGPLTGPYGRATVGAGIDPVCSSTLANGDRVTVYDEGSAAFGHAFCTSFSSGS